MELGVAGTIKTVQIVEVSIADGVNRWLKDNPDEEVLDIKFSANESYSEALIIYRIQ